MGSHAGFVGCDSADVPIDLTRHLRASLQRGDGATECYFDASVFVCHRAVRAGNPAADALPFRSAAGTIVAFDGCLFQKSDISARVRTALPPDAPDAAVVAAAYETWGVRCLEHLLGEWGLAIYDPARRALILACDYSGAVPLYYAIGASHTTWSSELATFASRAGMNRINTDYLVGFIWHTPELGATPFEGVEAVPGGGVIEIKDGVRTSGRGWRPDLGARIVYRDDRDYEAHFRDVFGRVIADRLATSGPVWAELSGGLDSSSIVCVADRLARDAYGGQDKLHTVSYDFVGGDSDEDRIHREEVHRAVACANTTIETRNLRLLTLNPRHATPLPTYANGVVPQLAGLMREAQARTLLSGEGGDGLMLSEGQYGPCLTLRERLLQGRWSGFVREWQAFGEWTKRSVWDILLHDVVSCRRWLRRRRRGRPIPQWLSTACVTRFLDRAPDEREDADVAAAPATVRLAYYAVDWMRRSVAGQSERLTSTIDASYPYLDPRLVQFMLAVPFAQKLRPGEARSLQRRALRGVLPERVRSRVSKSIGVGPLIQTVQREWPVIETLLSPDARLAQRGIVDVAVLRETAAAVRNGMKIRGTSAMWSAIVAEMWLRHQEGSNAADPWALAPCVTADAAVER